MNFSTLQKFLHKTILGNNFLNKVLFDLEKILYVKSLTNNQNNGHIFIAGLSRSGSTILTNHLYETGEFGSLVYRDMPFIICPNFYKNFTKKIIDENFYNRIHDDNIKININSPEALDQFFLNIFNKNYAEEYLSYINLILLKNNKKRYLSKNNNIHNKISEILKFLPKANFLIIFRDPINQSISLLNQHKKLSEKQSLDKFILFYMDKLGHNEFGNNYKYKNEPINFYDHTNINHWLEQWVLFYKKQKINFANNNNIIFINYEHLCDDKEYLLKLNNVLKINKKNKSFFSNKNKYSDIISLARKEKIDDNFDKNLVNQSYIIYNELTELSLKRINKTV